MAMSTAPEAPAFLFKKKKAEAATACCGYVETGCCGYVPTTSCTGCTGSSCCGYVPVTSCTGCTGTSCTGYVVPATSCTGCTGYSCTGCTGCTGEAKAEKKTGPIRRLFAKLKGKKSEEAAPACETCEVVTPVCECAPAVVVEAAPAAAPAKEAMPKAEPKAEPKK
ncbi:hypothetical protein [Tuwongella immobilis]|nr:hypothetical protein [Tuwongella immobilis]